MATYFRCLMRCVFSPFILLYNSINIYCVGCISIYWLRFLRFLCGRGCCLQCWKFTDHKFPRDEETEWKRAPEIDETKKWCLFQHKIDPCDVQQGGLGDCYLMCCIALIATRPHFVRNMFITKELSIRGKYKIRMFDSKNKKWEVITVDDQIPVDSSGRTKYSHSVGNELWVIILEKAYAKLNGGYKKIGGGGWMGDVLTAFTGCKNISLSQNKDKQWTGNGKKMESAVDLFYVLKAHVDAGAFVTCCTSEFGKEIVDKRGGQAGETHGIIGGHAYSILAAKDVKLSFFGGKRVLLLQLRNPWGSGEWTGAWSDKAPEWDQHPSIAKEVGRVVSDDGSFFMAVEDFVLYYTSVCLIEYKHSAATDLALEFNESTCYGPFCGCISGCCSFWCCCRGARAIFFAPDAATDLRAGDGPKTCCNCFGIF